MGEIEPQKRRWTISQVQLGIASGDPEAMQEWERCRRSLAESFARISEQHDQFYDEVRRIDPLFDGGDRSYSRLCGLLSLRYPHEPLDDWLKLTPQVLLGYIDAIVMTDALPVDPAQTPAEPQWVAVDSAHAKQSLKTWSVDAATSDQTGIRRVSRGRYEVRIDRLKHYIADKHWGKYKEIL